jgi:hypothetical protein
MSDEAPTIEPVATQPSDSEILRRLLAAMESNQRRGSFELILAIMLALATLSSTWCGYQATLWNRAAAAAQSAADRLEREATANSMAALEHRTFDAVAVMAFWQAARNRSDTDRDAIFIHMRPQLQRALEASLAEGFLDDPQVPGPFQRPEYLLDEAARATALRTDAGNQSDAARDAGRNSGAFILITLMFAPVLFFGGIRGTLSSPRIRMTLGATSLLLYIATLALMLTLPVAKA